MEPLLANSFSICSARSSWPRALMKDIGTPSFPIAAATFAGAPPGYGVLSEG